MKPKRLLSAVGLSLFLMVGMSWEVGAWDQIDYQRLKEGASLVSIPKMDERQPKRKCFDTFQSLKVKNNPEVSSL